MKILKAAMVIALIGIFALSFFSCSKDSNSSEEPGSGSETRTYKNAVYNYNINISGTILELVDVEVEYKGVDGVSHKEPFVNGNWTKRIETSQALPHSSGVHIIFTRNSVAGDDEAKYDFTLTSQNVAELFFSNGSSLTRVYSSPNTQAMTGIKFSKIDTFIKNRNSLSKVLFTSSVSEGNYVINAAIEY